MRYLALLMLVGCGVPVPNFMPIIGVDAGVDAGPKPEAPTRVAVENRYAESIFTVDVTPEGGALARLLDSVRVASSDSATSSSALNVGAGTKLTVKVDAISLGQHHRFTAETEVPAANRTLLLIYDYDLALADFRVRYRWDP